MRLLVTTIALLALAAVASAQAGPATGPAPTTAPKVGEVEMKILQALEKAGDRHRTIRAEIAYEVINRMLGDREARGGWVAYSKGDANSPTRFRVTFNTLRLGAGRPMKVQVDYAFDGRWLSVAKHKTKTLTMYQLAAKGDRVEPLRIGKGPFPVPFGQTVDDVLRYFVPTARRVRPGAPENTVYMRLDPRPEHVKTLPTTRLELWIHRTTHLPVRIRSRDKNKNLTTVTFSDIRTNKEVDPDVFTLPRRLGWETVRRPLKAGPKSLAP